LVNVFIAVAEIALPANALRPGNGGHFFINLFGDCRVNPGVHEFFRFGHVLGF
jgi:hypothetical protein